MAVSKWFDYNGYMANKLVQVQKAEPDANWNMTKLVNTFAENGFIGADGAEKHFEAYGQAEDVAPNAFFNAEEYYAAKAAEFYGIKDPKAVTELDVANIKLAIQNAGMSAWSHYEQYGNSEGVNPSNSFDTAAYMTAKLTAMHATAAGKDMTMAQLNAAFKVAGLSALEHFMIYGGAGTGEVTMKYEGTIPTEFAVPEDKQVNGNGSATGNVFTFIKEGATLTSDVSVDVTPAGHLSAKDDTINALTYAGKSTIIDASTTDHDTLNVMVNESTSAVVKNIETINLDMVSSTADFSFAAVSGAQQIVVSGVTAGTISGVDTVSATAPKIVLKDYASMLTVVSSNDVPNDDHATISLQGTALGAGLTLDDPGTSDQTFELLNISSDGETANVLDLQMKTANVASVTKTVITGKQDLTLVATAGTMLTGTAKFQAVDASGHEGSLTLQIGTDGKTDISSDTAVDLAGFKGLDKLWLHDNGDVVAVAGAADGLIIDIDSDAGSGSYTIDGNAATGPGVNDVLNVNLVNAKAATLTALTLTNSGFETLNLHNTGAAHTITTLTGGASALTETVVITGDKDLTIGSLVGVDVLDARDFDGKLTTKGGAAGESVTILGSDQNDTYTFVVSVASDTDGAHDTVTMGKGGDTIGLAAVAGWESYGYATAATAIDVTNYNLFEFNDGDSVAGTKGDNFGFDATTVDTFTGVAGAAFASDAGAKFAIDTWMDTTTVAKGASDLYGTAAATGAFGVYVKSAAEAYVYQNTNGDSVFGEGDFMVKITGSGLDSGDFTVVDGNLMFIGA